MDILPKILDLLKKQNKTQTSLCRYLNISRNIFTRWKSGDSISYRRHIDKISEFLGVPVEYFVDGDEYEPKKRKPVRRRVDGRMEDPDEAVRCVARIKSLCYDRGITLRFLTKAIKVPTAYFSSVESHKRTISSRNLQIIADILDTTTAFLRGETDKRDGENYDGDWTPPTDTRDNLASVKMKIIERVIATRNESALLDILADMERRT